MKNEAALEERFRREVRKRGGYALKYVPVGITGIPDRIVLLPGGRIGFAELKNPNGKGKLRSSQKRALATLERLGFATIVSHNISELTDWLDDLLQTS